MGPNLVPRSMVGHAQSPVGKPTTDGHYLHVGLVIADVVAELLQATERRGVSDGVGEADLAEKRNPMASPTMYCSATPTLTYRSGNRWPNGSTTPKLKSRSSSPLPVAIAGLTACSRIPPGMPAGAGGSTNGNGNEVKAVGVDDNV